MEVDFIKAKYTAIVSDMHLCEAEPVNARFPLWKKYKTRQFFFDDVFARFLDHIQERAQSQNLNKGEPQEIELILNGDIFDFDSVTSIPEAPSFRVSWLEKKRGLMPRPERSKYKIDAILKDHQEWVRALSGFLARGHRAIFVIGNHDLELHFPDVQSAILDQIAPTPELKERVRFVEWFYISNQDTLVEHGNQYDPYCVCEDPVNPYVQGYNYKSIRLPFGNLACRYILNGMGFFNPHVESNFIMSLNEYVRFFLKYMIRAQPLLMWDWFFGAVVTLWISFKERFMTPIYDPLKSEDRVNRIAQKANAQPRMVRELREIFSPPATQNPVLIAQELWLDRAFMIMLSFLLILQLFIVIKQFYNVSFFIAFVPLFLLLPFFLFYSKSVQSLVSSYKEPNERILATASAITKVNRIVFGHTHLTRHEIIGSVEHLNSGCWSPAFMDVECTQSIDMKTFVWIAEESPDKPRVAKVFVFDGHQSKEVLGPSQRERVN